MKYMFKKFYVKKMVRNFSRCIFMRCIYEPSCEIVPIISPIAYYKALDCKSDHLQVFVHFIKNREGQNGYWIHLVTEMFRILWLMPAKTNREYLVKSAGPDAFVLVNLSCLAFAFITRCRDLANISLPFCSMPAL